MSTSITKIGPASVTAGVFTDDQVALIKRTICKGASDDELALFMATSQRLGLDPFARQIFAVKRGGVMAIQVSIDGFRLAADRTGKYAPGRPTEYEHDKDGKLVAATAYVKKLVSDTWHEVGETSFFSEYASIGTPVWKSMPRVMLAKTAEARALRRAFPAELSGVYAPEEMDQADNKPVHSYKAPDAIEAVAVALEDAQSLSRAIEAAESIAELGQLIPALKRIPTTATHYETLRAAYGERRAALMKPRAIASLSPGDPGWVDEREVAQ